MTFGSLFAGIGGFDLGFERAGMRCVWQVELDPYCRRVLAKHWPDVPRWDDVRTFTGEGFERPDVICGGFPCQDISDAGRKEGIKGKRSGLWSEFARIVRVLRPRYVVVENVSALAHRGLGRVLGDLAESGYDAEWGCIRACDVGLAHRRNRLFIVAHAHRERCSRTHNHIFSSGWVHDCLAERVQETSSRARAMLSSSFIRRRSHGVPSWVDRIKGLGNAVVPQVAEWIGKRLMETQS